MTSAEPGADNSDASNPRETFRLSRWQTITAAMLMIGYAGYYLCRAHLSVCTSSLIEDKDLHLTKSIIGNISAFGLLFYAGGKFVFGSGADFLGGKRMFLVGMGGAVLCTVFFGMSGALPMFTLAWALNRGVQSGGWAALVKISSRWFSYSMYGTIMGIISLSYLFGDFLARLFLGGMLKWLDNRGYEHSWRIVFYTAAAILGAIFIACLLLVKESARGCRGAGASHELRRMYTALRATEQSNPDWEICFCHC